MICSKARNLSIVKSSFSFSVRHQKITVKETLPVLYKLFICSVGTVCVRVSGAWVCGAYLNNVRILFWQKTAHLQTAYLLWNIKKAKNIVQLSHLSQDVLRYLCQIRFIQKGAIQQKGGGRSGVGERADGHRWESRWYRGSSNWFSVTGRR